MSLFTIFDLLPIEGAWSFSGLGRSYTLWRAFRLAEGASCIFASASTSPVPRKALEMNRL
jgi:hypothetical protein